MTASTSTAIAASNTDASPSITKSDLGALEKRVREGLKSFIEVATALVEIRDTHGYKLRGYGDFAAYCEAEFGISANYANRQIRAAEIAKTTKQLIGAAPKNEAAARELAPVVEDPKTLEKVEKKLQKDGGSVATATAEQIREAVQAVKPVSDSKANAKKESPMAALENVIAQTRDICPKCEKTPESYVRGKEGAYFQCGDCGTTVVINVIPAELEMCPHCKAAIVSGSVFCGKCGEAI